MKKNSSQKKEPPNLAYRYTGIVIKMAVVILAGVYAGRTLDEKNELDFPVWTLILSIISVVLAIVIIIQGSSK